MVRKPNRMYRKIEGQPYTRQEFMDGVPQCRIAQFCTGNLKPKYEIALTLRTEEACQVRDTALEAARVAANKYLSAKAENMFFIRIRKYPHNILREHKLATGAGADRVSSGMRGAFGKAVGHAVRAQRGDELITVFTMKKYLEVAKEALRRARMKLPAPCKIVAEMG